MSWLARLELDYRHHPVCHEATNQSGRTSLQFEHDGPLRVLQSLYPEGPGVCHNVLVHPPGGLVGGDTLDIQVSVGANAHAFISTPGATRFYKTATEWATQNTRITLAEDARLEWFPLEALAYPGCKGRNLVQLDLASGAQCMGWDITALGLPASGQAFNHGVLEQQLHWAGHWLERSTIDAEDVRLLQSPVGLNGQRGMGTFWLASGTPWAAGQLAQMLEAVQNRLPNNMAIGATCPNPQLLVVRALAPMTEPVLHAFQSVWDTLRPLAWGLSPQRPRIWGV
jgi:urease accessory protein